MFKNLSLSVKLFLVVTPLFLLTFGITIYVNYRFQQEQVLGEAQQAAVSLANTVKKSMVHMMVKYEQIDDSYLKQLSQGGGDIENLNVLFYLDSLHLMEEYLTPQRVQKLRDREQQISLFRSDVTQEAFEHGETRMVMVCDPTLHVSEMAKHDDFPIATLSDGVPYKFWTCGKLRVVFPFRAESRCQTCHDVEIGHVLGAASMELPFGRTMTAVRTNAARSGSIFILLTIVTIVLGGFVFRRIVGGPVNRLVHATEMIGTQGLDFEIATNYDNDELGKLAASFREMQHRLRDAQKEVIHKERLSTIGQMASGIIHDFRNPISAISTTLQVLQMRSQTMSEERRKELHGFIRASVDRMNRMAQELLDFSRGEVRLNLQPVEVPEFVKEIETAVRKNLEDHNVQFTIACGCTTTVTLDKDRLQRAIINIINNAEDALEKKKGGSIALEVQEEQGRVVFSIKDDAGGIPETIRDKVFDAFVTAGKAKGTGLGLAITKKVIDQHQGDLYFETETGTGTTFYIKLPLEQRSGSQAA